MALEEGLSPPLTPLPEAGGMGRAWGLRTAKESRCYLSFTESFPILSGSPQILLIWGFARLKHTIFWLNSMNPFL